MTLQMGIALAIVILMIVMIMSDKFSFSAPALLACCLLVVTGISTIEDAFAGFVDKNVIMVAGFMAVMAGVQKTSLMGNIKHIMAKLATKGGFLAYAMIIIVVMLGTSLLGGGNTGYYVPDHPCQHPLQREAACFQTDDARRLCYRPCTDPYQLRILLGSCKLSAGWNGVCS